MEGDKKIIELEDLLEEQSENFQKERQTRGWQLGEYKIQRDEIFNAFIEVLEMYESEGFPDASFLYDKLFLKIKGKTWEEIKKETK